MMKELNDDIRDLLVLKLTGDLGPGEEDRINGLIATDPDVSEAWEEMQELFSTQPAAKEIDHFDSGQMVNSAKAIVMQNRASQTAGKAANQSFRLINILVVAATIIGIGVFIYLAVKPGTTQKVLTGIRTIPTKSVYLELAGGDIVDLSGNEQETEIRAGNAILYRQHDTLTFTAVNEDTRMNKLVVPAGKSYTIRLSDGSTVRLNAASELEFPFSFPGHKRNISLHGEAYVNVTAAPSKPFDVETPYHTHISVLGTEFNINSYESGKVTVSLVQGTVKMTAGKYEALLRPGFQGIYTIEDTLRTTTFDTNNVLSWLDGKYAFRDLSLRQLKPILERLYDTRIVFDHPAVAEKTFTGQINKTESLDSFLVSIAHDVNYYNENDTIHIK
jgi:transmembrane sensor